MEFTPCETYKIGAGLVELSFHILELHFLNLRRNDSIREARSRWLNREQGRVGGFLSSKLIV